MENESERAVLEFKNACVMDASGIEALNVLTKNMKMQERLYNFDTLAVTVENFSEKQADTALLSRPKMTRLTKWLITTNLHVALKQQGR